MSITSTIKTILIVGATSGLGEQFARRLHAMGKKVIITGRRAERLSFLKAELGTKIDAYQWDITDLDKVSSRASEITTAHPDTNSIFIMPGFGSILNFLDPSTSTDAKIIAECNTNVTAQMLLTRAFMPHLASVAAKGLPASYLLMGSGMGFVPNGTFPVYVATKAAIHALAVALRQNVSKDKNQNVKNNLSVVEVVAPYVATDFDKEFRNPAGPQPMPLEEFMENAMAQLALMGEDGKPPKEVAVGSAQLRLGLWRNSVGKYMKEVGMEG
ncbi:putative oxidoreductase [Lachnellula suecica]|uniref:Putative oxidoreductase n=1 Tax=Lachnellula suecica TaxID=602035 RepID=A0A8T9C863_9HELO|nr:putative oxidoreductase [Lachnellula suecica]